MAIGVIVVGTDFSDVARGALEWAVDLARPLGARVVIAHVYDLPIVGFPDASFILDPQTAARMSDDAQKALDGEVARVRNRGIPVEGILLQGDPRDALAAIATSIGAGLIVVGSHGRRGIARALLGSVAESLARTSTSTPVTVVHSKR
jgi:nucleotide-binding universal stress UspA family protein